MSPSPRAGLLLGVCALCAVVLPVPLAGLLGVALLSAVVVDAFSVRKVPTLATTLPTVMARGVDSPIVVERLQPAAGRATLRQPAIPDIEIVPSEGDERLEALARPRRRGRHILPAPAVRTEGALGLGRWHHRAAKDHEVVVYPDMPAARRLALSVRTGRFRGPGRTTRGPLGLGTDFESIRDYLPDDDVRQVNWRATARMGRPMSNQYRVEQDRDVICVIDTGRLMAAPLGDRTRLDAAVDAVAAITLVADALGDRCGVIAFDSEIRRHLRARRAGSNGVVRAVFDLEPRPRDSDYELAFRTVGGGKRAFVCVFTDLLEESAARSLLGASPILSRRHAVVVASATDTDLTDIVRTAPRNPADVYAASVALDVLGARARVAQRLRRSGTSVVEAPANVLARACVSAYLTAKSRARM